MKKAIYQPLFQGAQMFFWLNHFTCYLPALLFFRLLFRVAKTFELKSATFFLKSAQKSAIQNKIFVDLFF